MAYLKKDDTIFFADGNITSFVKKVAFRKYRKRVKDKETGTYKMRWKSMPYAICEVALSDDPDIATGETFLIPGYKLKKKVLHGRMLLIMREEYIAEYAKEYGNVWVRRLIKQENKKNESKNKKQS